MSVIALAGIRNAVRNLNPVKVRELGERHLNIALYAHTNEAYRAMEQFFLEGLQDRRRKESLEALTRGPAPQHSLR
jgi:macrodomain Ter protein organizer (MatP/YcbG family)